MGSRESRPLGDFERTQQLTSEVHPFNLVICLGLAGKLDERSLTGALEVLQRRHALLRSRIAGGRHGPRFELDDDRTPVPWRRVDRDGRDRWELEVESELERPFEPEAAPLARACLVSDGDGGERHEIVLAFHHAIVDAVAVTTVLRSLLDLAASGGRSTESWSSVLPRAADESLPASHRGLGARWSSGSFLARQMVDELGYRWRTRGVRARSAIGPFRCRVLSWSLDESETTRLVRTTRRRRVSVWSALNAAMLLCVARRRYSSGPLPHRYLAFPLLRPYLDPPVPDDVVASYFSILRLMVTLDHDTDLWQLARAIHDQSDRAAKGGEQFVSSRWGEMSMKTLLSQRVTRMSTIALNYSGAVELAAAGDLVAESLHAFVSNFPLGPEYTAQARVFRRRLWFDVLYLDSDMDEPEARAISDDMGELLGQASRVTT